MMEVKINFKKINKKSYREMQSFETFCSDFGGLTKELIASDW
jgi:hypothetical protein